MDKLRWFKTNGCCCDACFQLTGAQEDSYEFKNKFVIGGLPNFPALPTNQNPVHQKSKSLQPVIAKCIFQLKLRAHNHFVMHGYRLLDQLSIWNHNNIDEKHKRVITWSSGSATTTIMATPTFCMTGVTDGVCSPWAAGTLTHGASAGARMQTFPLCAMFSIHPKWFNGKAEHAVSSSETMNKCVYFYTCARSLASTFISVC